MAEGRMTGSDQGRSQLVTTLTESRGPGAPKRGPVGPKEEREEERKREEKRKKEEKKEEKKRSRSILIVDLSYILRGFSQGK